MDLLALDVGEEVLHHPLRVRVRLLDRRRETAVATEMRVGSPELIKPI